MMRMRYHYCFLAGVTMVLQFILIKYLYPYPNFMQDSYNYLRSAVTNIDANLWPVGYAKLIRFAGFFSHSDTLLVFIQFFIYHICGLYYFYTLLELRPCSKWLQWTMFAVIFLNPAILYLSNYVASDVYFIGISLVWMAQLFRLTYKPTFFLLCVHLVVLLLAFTVRYHALIYPVISMTVIVFCQYSKWVKVWAVGMAVFLVGAFILYTTRQTETHMGRRQFSVFSGWQMANNAVYAYVHMPVRSKDTVPKQFTNIQARVDQWLDSVPMADRPNRPIMAYFIWDPGSPLQPEPGALHISDNAGHLRKMAEIAPLLNDYGKYLIARYPVPYIQYYICPNLLQYVFPPAENLSVYNDDVDTILPVAKEWFQYKDTHVFKRAGEELRLFNFYPYLMVITMLVFLIGWIRYLYQEGRAIANEHFRYALTIVTYYWLVNVGFSVLASPVVLRYQLFNLIVGATFGGMLWDMKVYGK
ncbi:hypothetical protein [Chitinophaga sp. LS1]|uniref:hypothetical protein n=1 Tax=Chitinophaga sp. LS1 TaxID=3051176 RepID=UPI002AAAA89D|nr:hypothetical protein [Chitinophaga sp. LS1]WPV67881.1 hypothetical protein QQL36_03980 [Chitinophaga sp. LS1]